MLPWPYFPPSYPLCGTVVGANPINCIGQWVNYTTPNPLCFPDHIWLPLHLYGNLYPLCGPVLYAHPINPLCKADYILLQVCGRNQQEHIWKSRWTSKGSGQQRWIQPHAHPPPREPPWTIRYHLHSSWGSRNLSTQGSQKHQKWVMRQLQEAVKIMTFKDILMNNREEYSWGIISILSAGGLTGRTPETRRHPEPDPKILLRVLKTPT